MEMVGPLGLEPGTKGKSQWEQFNSCSVRMSKGYSCRSIHYRHNIETGSETRAGDAEPGLAFYATRQP